MIYSYNYGVFPLSVNYCFEICFTLRTVATFNNVQMFCASRKVWFNRQARYRNGTDVINYAIKYFQVRD